MKLRRSLRCAACWGVLAALAALPAAATMYKWTDETGRVVYGDTPPAGVKAERLNAAVSPADPNAVRDLAAKDAELKKRQQQRADEATKAAKADAEAKKKSDQCVQARGQIRTLRQDTAVYRYNEKGEKVYFDAGARAKAIADNEKILHDLNCPPAPAS